MIKNKKRAIPNFFIALILVGGISWVCGNSFIWEMWNTQTMRK